MKFELQKLSVMMIDASITAQELTENILYFKKFSIRSIIVLPYHVSRVKQLLTDTNIRVGCLVDFPLGQGTTVKKTFETVQAQKEGASDIYVTMTPQQMINSSNEDEQQINRLSLGQCEVGLFFNDDVQIEDKRQELLLSISKSSVKNFTFGYNSSIKKALQNLSIFQLRGKKSLNIQVNVTNPSLLEIELLFQSGASYIGIDNGKEILSLLS